MIGYVYDNFTFRLLRQRSEKFIYSQSGDQHIYTSDGSVRQDSAFTYDLTGNIISSKEANVSECGIGGTNSLEREFNYDPLYRILSANGRENSPTITPIWDDQVRSSDPNTTQAYTRKYTYDKVGNVQQIKQLGTSGFTRDFNYISSRNQLQNVEIGANNYNYSYDNVGNQLTENTERHFEWDAANRLLLFKNQVGSSEPSVIAQYLYDSAGNRVKKIVRKQGGGYEIRTYIDGIFEHFTDETDEQNTVHIMNDQSRVATIRIGDTMGDTTPAVKYNLENNIYSSLAVLDDNGTIVNTQEYYPFGETSFGSYGKKRYQYVGKERDEESGLYYYGARYYAPWIARFISVDPLSAQYAQLSPYNYSDNNPINDYDIDGMQNNNTPKTENRTGNDPNAPDEKAYREEAVRDQLKNGEKLHNIHFVYENFANTNGDTGDLTYSYKKEYGANKEYVRETWHHKGQKPAYSFGIGDRFDPNEPKKVENKSEDDSSTGTGGDEIDIKRNNDRSQAGNEEIPPPPPKKSRLTQRDLDNILDGASIYDLIPSSPYHKIVADISSRKGSPKDISKQLSKFDFKAVKVKVFIYYDTNINIYYLTHKQREVARNKLMQDLNNLVGSTIKFEVWFTKDSSQSTGTLTGYFK